MFRKSLTYLPVLLVAGTLPSCFSCPGAERDQGPAVMESRREVIVTRRESDEVMDTRREYRDVRERDWCGEYITK